MPSFVKTESMEIKYSTELTFSTGKKIDTRPVLVGSCYIGARWQAIAVFKQLTQNHFACDATALQSTQSRRANAGHGHDLRREWFR